MGIFDKLNRIRQRRRTERLADRAALQEARKRGREERRRQLATFAVEKEKIASKKRLEAFKKQEPRKPLITQFFEAGQKKRAPAKRRKKRRKTTRRVYYTTRAPVRRRRKRKKARYKTVRVRV